MTAVRAVVAIMASLGIAASSFEAHACEGEPCIDGYVYPPVGGVVPLNARGFLIRPTMEFYESDISQAHIRLLDPTGTPVPLTFDTTTFAPAVFVGWDNLERGTYTITSSAACQDERPDIVTTFTVQGLAPLASTLGRIVVSPMRVGRVAVADSALCTGHVEAAYYDLEVELAPDADRWRDVILYQTIVDGDPWSPTVSIFDEPKIGSSWAGRGRDRIFMPCGTGRAVTRTVQVLATVPGIGGMATPPVTLTLDCDAPPSSGPANPTDPSDPASPIEPGDLMDPDDPEGMNPAAPPPGELPPPTGGCGCRASHKRGASSVWVVGLLMLLAFGFRSIRKNALTPSCVRRDRRADVHRA